MKVVLLSFLVLFINFGCIPGSDIYSSINWVPQNPLLKADGGSCAPGHRTLKVQLQSKVNFICPNTATVLQKTLVGVQTANMYENLWIVYNKTAFDNCDTTLKGQIKTSRLLLQCNTPTKLNYFQVLFAQFTAEQNGLRFQGGETYYFIGTSDGTESHINNTSGGHCNDTQKGIFMKIEVYVCKKSNQTYSDSKCEENVGVLKCPEHSTPSTTVPATVTPTQTMSSLSSSSIQPVPPTTQEISTETTNEKSTQTRTTNPGPNNETTTTTKVVNSSYKGLKDSAFQTGDDKVQKQLEIWRAFAIVILAFVLLLIFSGLIYFKCSRKNDKSHIWPWKKGINLDPEIIKNPAERQVSVGGVSNRGFTDRNSVIAKVGGEDRQRKSGSPSHLFYDMTNGNAFVNENPAIESKVTDNCNSTLDIHENNLRNGPAPDGNVFIQNNPTSVLYDKG